MQSPPKDLQEEIRYRILRILALNPGISQRELSTELGVSLGKTNYLLRALKNKGLIKISNFLQNERKVSYAYLLTPKGVAEKIDITTRFLQRKREEFEIIQSELLELEKEALGYQSLQEKT